MKRTMLREPERQPGAKGRISLHHELTPNLIGLCQGHSIGHVLSRVQENKAGPWKTAVILVVPAREQIR